MSMTDLPNVHKRKPTASFSSLAPNVHWARRMIRTSRWSFERRQIYDYELLYVQKGVIHATVGEESFTLPAGSLLYIPAQAYHSIRIESEVSVFGIHFDYFGEMTIAGDHDVVVKDYHLRGENSFCLEPEFPEIGPLLSCSVYTAPPRIVPLLESIIEQFNAKKTGYELACRGLLLLVLHDLLLSQNAPDSRVHPKYGQTILRLAKRMETDYAEDWSNSRVAVELNLHEDYAAKLFKETVGLPPSKYMQQVRHQEAKRILRETDYKLETVGKLVGYEDLHYFSRIFNKLEGISPGHYRKLTNIL
jgi:AraC-like DNA-binding protein/mannose-6-phosphate isomerase-like protein (cupin superfamily)